MIRCAWCHLPASFIWTVRDADPTDRAPVVLPTPMPTCERCDALADPEHEVSDLPRLIEHALREWSLRVERGHARDLASRWGVSWQDPDWREPWRERITVELAAWIARRDTRSDIPAEDIPPGIGS